MANDNEPAKLLLPYLQRADELQKHEHLVAYYCRLYAMERGLKIPQKERTKTTNSILISLMNQLEKDKKSLKLGPEDNLYVEGFGLNVFTKADKQDRAGRADLNTAKTFYAASIFFEILNQFGELHPDIEQKQKYSAWKAADIRKALKEGRRPEPGPPGGDKDSVIPSNAPSSTYDLGSSESFTASQPGADIPTRLQDKDLGRSTSFLASQPDSDMLPQSQDEVILQPSAKIPTAPSTYLPSDYPPNDLHQPQPPNDLHQPQPPNRPDNSSYLQPYHHQSYSFEQPQPSPQNYPSHENSTPPLPPPPPYTYNYQSYPSFSEENLPTAPTHYSPYYQQGSDAGYAHQSGPPSSNFQSPVQYSSSKVNGMTHTESPPPSTAASFKYDSNYQPPPDKITEAHKAARFAVGALAFDDVPVAVDFLRRSLELLTNPSASQ